MSTDNSETHAASDDLMAELAIVEDDTDLEVKLMGLEIPVLASVAERARSASNRLFASEGQKAIASVLEQLEGSATLGSVYRVQKSTTQQMVDRLAHLAETALHSKKTN